MNAAPVFTLQSTRGMHQLMRQVAIGGKKKQARRVDIQSTHADPARRTQPGQVIEYSWPSLTIGARAYFAGWLVIHDDTRCCSSTDSNAM
jgi:hypothetical protein